MLAFLEQWYQERTVAIQNAIARRGTSDEAAMLTIFDVFDDWFREDAAQVSSFLHVLMEMGSEHPLGKASIQYLDRTRQQIAELAESAGLNEPHDFAWSIHILIKGAIVSKEPSSPPPRATPGPQAAPRPWPGCSWTTTGRRRSRGNSRTSDKPHVPFASGHSPNPGTALLDERPAGSAEHEVGKTGGIAHGF